MADELIKLSIDGKELEVPKGTNLIEAAKMAGAKIPHYCYHRHLSIAGNCRMCQVKIEGAPKLVIACNTVATEGMKVFTHKTSEEVAEAQRATLEFLLINHPLDCTVCDQSGHCKLQDYYYKYNAEGSRFIEQKEHKVKAEVLGPEVVYDGERCIVCTRCVRFCDEITKTSELGVFNRGDRSVIGIYPDKVLDNPFSGTVCDLCPVGALTHRRWRFNTRIWYTTLHETICTGCSTGCNIKLAVRDEQIVYVKARLNSSVNQGWMCDEGRYGCDRFTPHERLVESLVRKGENYEVCSIEHAVEKASKVTIPLLAEEPEQEAVFISPMLTLEEMWMALKFCKMVLNLSPDSPSISVQCRRRSLSDLEAILISPDYAPNARGAAVLGVVPDNNNWRKALEEKYLSLVGKVRARGARKVVIIGDYAVCNQDLDDSFIAGVNAASCSVQITARPVQAQEGADALFGTRAVCQLILPGRTVHERGGIMINRDGRLQKVERLLTPPQGTYPDWMLLHKIAIQAGKAWLPSRVTDERGIWRELQGEIEAFRELSYAKIGDKGKPL